jgi:hypothetical protein
MSMDPDLHASWRSRLFLPPSVLLPDQGFALPQTVTACEPLCCGITAETLWSFQELSVNVGSAASVAGAGGWKLTCRISMQSIVASKT